MSGSTLYEILQVSPRAEKEIIEAAYKKLAFKYHPDRYSGFDAAERMKEINKAYSILKDKDKREQYDKLMTLLSYETSSSQSEKLNNDEESAKARIENAQKILNITSSVGWMLGVYFFFVVLIIMIFPQPTHQYLAPGLFGVLFIIYIISTSVRDRLITKEQRLRERKEIEEETYRGR